MGVIWTNFLVFLMSVLHYRRLSFLMYLIYTSHALATSYWHIYFCEVMHVTSHALVTFPHILVHFTHMCGENEPHQKYLFNTIIFIKINLIHVNITYWYSEELSLYQLPLNWLINGTNHKMVHFPRKILFSYFLLCNMIKVFKVR